MDFVALNHLQVSQNWWMLDVRIHEMHCQQNHSLIIGGS
jgi:hypothetical protein